MDRICYVSCHKTSKHEWFLSGSLDKYFGFMTEEEKRSKANNTTNNKAKRDIVPLK